MLTGKAALIHAAFKGLAEGLLAGAEPAVEQMQRRARKTRRRFPTTSKEQLPLSPELVSSLQQQFEPVVSRPPEDTPAPTLESLDDLMRGNESVEAFARQLRMQKAAAEFDPPKKPEEQTVTSWGISEQP